MKSCVIFLLAAGCTPTLVGRAHDQNPLTKPDRVSEGIAIATKDAQIIANGGEAVGNPGKPGYASSSEDDTRYGTVSNGRGTTAYYHPTFHQSAIFQAKSDTQLVFLLELTNRWPELTHAQGYEITLMDDRGNRWHPVAMQSSQAYVVRRTMALARTDLADQRVFGVGNGVYTAKHDEEIGNDGKAMLGARSIVEFRGPALLRPDTKSLTLLLKGRGRSLEFIWDFDH